MNQKHIFDALWDLECQIICKHIFFCYWKHHLKAFGRDGTVKKCSQRMSRLHLLLNYNGVCRAAPGFARVFYMNVSHIHPFKFEAFVNRKKKNFSLYISFMVKYLNNLIKMHFNCIAVGWKTCHWYGFTMFVFLDS